MNNAPVLMEDDRKVDLHIMYDVLNPTEIEQHELEWYRGVTLGDYLQGLDDSVDWMVFHNGVEVENIEAAKDTAFEKGDRLSLAVIPQGGGGFKSILRALVTVAFVAVGSIIGGPIGAAIGGLVAGLVNAFLLTPKPKISDNEQETTYGIDGAKNSATENIPFPVVYGEFRQAGNIIDLYTENLGDTQYLYMRMVMADGLIEGMTDIEVNEQPIDNFDNVSTKTTLGELNPVINPWFQNTIRQINKNIKLDTSWTEHETTDQIDRARFDVMFPKGLVDIDKKKGDYRNRSVTFQVEYRPDDVTPWENIETDIVSQASLPDRPASTTQPDISGFDVQVQVPVDELRDLPPNTDLEFQYRKVGDSVWNVKQVAADVVLANSQSSTPEFAEEQPHNNLGFASWNFYEYDIDYGEWEFGTNYGGISNVQGFQSGGQFTVTDSRTAQIRRSYQTGVLPKGNYELRIRRTTATSTSEYILDEAYLTDIAEIESDAVAVVGRATLSIRIKLTDQLNAVPTVTALVQGSKIQKYDIEGNPTVVEYDNNPAWCYVDAMTSVSRGAQISVDDIDWAALHDWEEHCTDNSLEYNGVFSGTGNVHDAVVEICGVGDAAPINLGTKHSVVIDRPREPVQMFNSANMVKESFSVTYMPLTDRANEFEVTYYDKLDRNKEKTIRYVDPNAVAFNETPRSVSIPLRGVDNRERAAEELWKMIYANRLLVRTVTFDAYTDVLAASLGDVILVQSNQMEWSQGGLIGTGSDDQSAIVLDQEVPYVGGTSYGLIIQHDAAKASDVTVSSKVGQKLLVTGDANLYSKDIHRVIINGEDYPVVKVDDGTTYQTITLDGDLSGISVSDNVECWRTDVLEERTVTGHAVVDGVSVLTLDTALVEAPEFGNRFIYGEVTEINQPYTIQSITGSGIERRTVSAVEYNAAVYNPGEVALEVPITPLDTRVVPQVKDLRIDFDLVSKINQQTVNVHVKWNSGHILNYTGADVYARINGADWRATNTVWNVNEIHFTGNIDDEIEVKVVAFNNRFDRSPIAYAPTTEATIDNVTLTEDGIGISYIPDDPLDPIVPIEDLRPAEANSTEGAPAGTFVAGTLAEIVVSDAAVQAALISDIEDDVSDLFTTYGSTAAAATSAAEALTAQTAAELAQTAAEAAEIASETAQTASELAQVAAEAAETHAENSATAASNSETNASADAMSANTSASDAAASAVTSADEAAISTAAAVAASDSETAASASEASASASETLSAQYSTDAAMTAALLIPGKYSSDVSLEFVSQVAQTPEASNNSPANYNDPDHGWVKTFAQTTVRTDNWATRGVVPCIDEKIYKFSFKWEITGVTGTGSLVSPRLRRMPNSGYTSGTIIQYSNPSLTVGDFLVEFTAGVAGSGADVEWTSGDFALRPYLSVTNGNGTLDTKCISITVTDVTSEVAAESSAAAALVSEGAAFVSEGNASTSASSAAASAVTAGDEASDSAASATAASGFATTASSDASSASASELLAAEYANESLGYASTTGITPDGSYEAGTQFVYSSLYNTKPALHVDVTHEASYQNRTNVLLNATGARRDFRGEEAPIDPNRQYRLKMGVYVNTEAGVPYLGYNVYDASGAVLGQSYTSSVDLGATGWYDYVSPVITGTGTAADEFKPGAVSAFPFILSNLTGNQSGAIIAVDYMYLEDVTESELSATSAAASLASEAAAVVAASNASTHESNSAASAVTAADEATDAASSATAASDSETNASAHESAAAASSTLAATYEREALSSATGLGLTKNSNFMAEETHYYNHIYAKIALPGTNFDFDDDYQGAARAIVNRTGSNLVLRTHTVPFDASRDYRLHMRVYNSDATNGQYRLYCGTFDHPDEGSGNHSGWLYYAINQSLPAGWSELSIDLNSAGPNVGANLMSACVYLNEDSHATTEMALDYLYIEDVTESTSAASYATAASNSEAAASGSVASASADATLAAGFASDAAAEAVIATAQAVIATDEAAAAVASAGLSASLATGHINKNSSFADYWDGQSSPEGWYAWSSGTKTRVDGTSPNPYALNIVSSAGANGGVYIPGHTLPEYEDSIEPNSWYVIEAEVTLVAGTMRGAGVYMPWYTKPGGGAGSGFRMSFTGTDENGVQVNDGVVGTRYKYAVMFESSATTNRFIMYAMNHWTSFNTSTNNGDGNRNDTSASNEITWHQCGVRKANQAEIATQTVLPTIEANVAVNQAAIASIEGAAAYYEIVVAASGGNPAKVRLTAGSAGSAVALIADSISIENPDVSGETVEVARFSNGKAQLNNAVIRGLQVFPRSDSDIALSVQLEPLNLLGADGDTVEYQDGDSFGANPQAVTRDISGLPALAAGESYDIRAINITDTQFEVYAKKLASATQTNRSDSTASTSGSVPTRRINKSVAADAYDDRYQFTFTATIPRTYYFAETEPPITYYNAEWNGSVTIYVTDADNSNAYVAVATVPLSASYFGSVAPGTTKTITKTVVLTIDKNIGSHGGAEFGANPVSGTTLNSFTNVSYVTQTTGTATAVTTLIPWSVYPPPSD